MKDVANKAYKGLLAFVDSFANSTAGTAIEHRTDDNIQPGPPEEQAGHSVPDYVFPSDNYIDPVFDSKLTRSTLRAFARKHYGSQLDQILQHDTKLTPTNYPSLHSNYRHCCQTLGITTPPELYITSSLAGINALSLEINGVPVVLVSLIAVALLSDLEQRFLLGHELGHIQQGHMLIHTVQGLLLDLNKRSEIMGSLLSGLIDVPLSRWYRNSEFTADRAGYLCCPDINVITALFSRITHSPRTALSQYLELSEAHPNVSTRLEKLKVFSLSN